MMSVRIITPSAPLRSGPAIDASLDSEGLYGEAFKVIAAENGFVFGALSTDGYQGWLPQNCLGDLPEPNAQLISSMSNVTRDSEIKSHSCFSLSLGAQLTVLCKQDQCAKIVTNTSHGFLPCRHILPLEPTQYNTVIMNEIGFYDDWVGVAESLIGSPYKWGGRTAWGLDCSALVQLALSAVGVNVPRDSGPQHEVGVGLDHEKDLRRGDLVFWKGHVGIMQGQEQLLHANAYHMAVASELLSKAIKRIGMTAGPVTALRRPVCI